MEKTRSDNKISITVVRRANERLKHRNSESGINVKTVYAGRDYGVHLSEDKIKEVYEQSLNKVLKKK